MTRRQSSEREAYWQDLIGLQQRSGLSISAFCREHDVAEGSFFYWRRKLAKRQPENGAGEKSEEPRPGKTLSNAVGTFVPVGIPAPTSTNRASCEVVLPDGCRVIAPMHCDAGWLREILGALGERAC